MTVVFHRAFSRKHSEVAERLCYGYDLFRRTGFHTLVAFAVRRGTCGETMDFFAVGNPTGFRHKPVMLLDPFLNLLVGGRLKYHNVLYDTSIVTNVNPPLAGVTFRIIWRRSVNIIWHVWSS
jgi:hypothetical protein